MYPDRKIQTIWVSACEIAIDEVAALRAARPAWAARHQDGTESAILGLLGGTIDAMRPFSSWALAGV